MSPLYPEEDEDNFSLQPHHGQTTWMEKLRKFHSQFDSSVRAILRDCLFREIDEAGIVIFQILCHNQAVQKRLIQKREKIRQMVHLIWLDKIDKVAFCINNNDGWQCQVFEVRNSRL